jgi:hypothetical protein
MDPSADPFRACRGAEHRDLDRAAVAGHRWRAAAPRRRARRRGHGERAGGLGAPAGARHREHGAEQSDQLRDVRAVARRPHGASSAWRRVPEP